MKKIVCFLLFMALGSLTLWGQARLITGRVVSAEDGTPLPGVSVAVQGTSIGAITDVNGNYEINVPQDGRVLVFSFVGLTTQELELGNRTTVDVVLEQDLLQLDELDEFLYVVHISVFVV